MVYTLFLRENYMKLFERDFIDLKLKWPLSTTLLGDFSIELAEKQISGRNIKLEIDYKKVLNVDVL